MDDCISGERIDTNAFVPSGLAQVTLNGHVYGIPEFNTVRLTMANADLLSAASLTLDDVNGSNWEKVRAASQTLTASSGGGLSVIGFDSKLPEFLPSGLAGLAVHCISCLWKNISPSVVIRRPDDDGWRP